MGRRLNPLAFRRGPVTIIVTIVYLALLIPIVVIEHVLPTVPDSLPEGLDLESAWRDLQHLTAGFHPYNSRRNDAVRAWLLTRIEEILEENRNTAGAVEGGDEDRSVPEVFVFDDLQSNLTAFVSSGGVYFEGTNILVYIRGTDDDPRRWWESPGREPAGRGGVLVNAHYDSVSTGYGATDDGVGVVSCLQLIKYFTTPGHEPRRGLVVLFNNGEEDYLNGARVYSQHPLSKFPHTFLNLEGAGAGGRATLFRSSDTQVTRFYARAEHPYGTVLSDFGFRLVKSETDYVVFEGDLGLRGLDVAFFKPRARYHTDQDDTRHTSKRSLWHMLSAAVATVEGLVSDTSSDFEGKPSGPGKVPSGEGSQAVWFDLFGTAFAVFELHTLFALSVTLLIVGPLTLFVTSIILSNVDRMYLFSLSTPLGDYGDKVSLRGLRGFFRFPFVFGTATGTTFALAFLLAKVNPYIAHSSEYAVWGMMISAWVFIAWFLSRIADFVRPSALHRAYIFTWLSILMWSILVVSTVYQNRDGIAGSYFVWFYTLGVFLAAWVSYLELFALPRKREYAGQFRTTQESSRRASSLGSRLLTPTAEETGPNEEPEATESTSLLRGGRQTFANYTRIEGRDDDGADGGSDAVSDRDPNVYGSEQAWSSRLPKWTWVIQLLLVAPVVIVLVGQIGVFLTEALHQTAQDGGSALLIYLAIAILTAVLFTPTLPFIHRYTYHIPVFLLLIFIGTLIYNLVAFPFSANNRLKLFFAQNVNLDLGTNEASLTGAFPYVRDAVSSLPSARGQELRCTGPETRTTCTWTSHDPRVVSPLTAVLKNNKNITNWVRYNATRLEDTATHHRARIYLGALSSRACAVSFSKPLANYRIPGSAVDETRFPTLPPADHAAPLQEVRLFSRTWNKTFTVEFEWTKEDDSSSSSTSSHMTGTVTCFWDDFNDANAIPALRELKRYAPDWVAVSKLGVGLVRGHRNFTV
ncbi:hypothetical protein VTN31DRAFT_5598 [Thermomyces dupontii]|uniref:uncharacterized protein n=1 Tax=Talaromyces thermophilus TaxID=28565 RepID=UPI00374410BC